MDLRELSSTTTKSLQPFVKGRLLQAQSGAAAFNELQDIRVAEVARAARKARSRRSIQKGGVLYAHQPRSMVRQKEQDSLEKHVAKARRSLEVVFRKAENSVKKQWKDISKQIRKAVKDRNRRIRLQRLLFNGVSHSIQSVQVSSLLALIF